MGPWVKIVRNGVQSSNGALLRLQPLAGPKILFETLGKSTALQGAKPSTGLIAPLGPLGKKIALRGAHKEGIK